MYQTSSNYRQKIYDPSTKHLLKIYINNVEIDTKYILECKLSQTLISNEQLTLGSVTSQAVELQLYKTVVPNNINNIYIESGINGETIPIGYFNVDEISKKDDYTITLKLLDNMIKFETNYNGSTLNYPCTLKTILQDICSKIGIELRNKGLFKYEQTNSSIRQHCISQNLYQLYSRTSRRICMYW